MKKFSEKSVGILSYFDLKQVRYKIFYWVIMGILIIMSLICLVPSLWVLMSGFKSSQEIYSTASFFPKSFSIMRVKEAWEALQLMPNIISTFIVAIGEIASMLIICAFGGFVLSRIKPKGSKIVFVAIVWTMMMPMQMRTVALFMSFIDFPLLHIDITNTYIPLFLLAAANSFNVVLFKNFFDSVPISLIESARIDGCRNIQIFYKIMLPLSMPMVIYTSIIAFNAAWSEFFWALLTIDNQNMQTLPARIFRLKSAAELKTNIYMMALTIACIPPLIMFVFFQKKIIGGINVGGVKG